MPRRARVVVEDAVYHVYNRLARGEEVFAREGEVDRFVDLLARGGERDGLVVLAWCVMPNHYHIAVRCSAVPLARTLGYVQARFAQGYNRRSHASGPLWQSRYKAKLVEDERYLVQLIAYIHLNPVAAGLAGDPASYRDSGHREILGRAAARLVDVGAVLELLAPDRRDARRVYLATLRGIQNERWRAEAPGRLPWWQPEPDRPLEDAGGDHRRPTRRLDRRLLTASVLIVRACRHLGIRPGSLAGAGKERAVSRVRYLIAAVGVERWGVGTKALADALGRRADAVTRWVHCGAERRQQDAEFRRAYEDLDAALAGGISDAP